MVPKRIWMPPSRQFYLVILCNYVCGNVKLFFFSFFGMSFSRFEIQLGVFSYQISPFLNWIYRWRY